MEMNESTDIFSDGRSSHRDPMRVVLMSPKGNMQDIWLPARAEGMFRFQTEVDEQNPSLLQLRAEHGSWYAVCGKGAFFFAYEAGANGSVLERRIGSSVELTDRSLYHVRYGAHVFVLYSESENEQSNVFHHYYVEKNSPIRIGRNPDCDICYSNRLVSRVHAALNWDGSTWMIRDEDSRNGVFLNGKMIKQASLALGDVIYIMGLRILMGAGFIALNDGNDRVRITSLRLRLIERSYQDQTHFYAPTDGRQKEKDLFNRLPRKKKALDPQKITIEGPPSPLGKDSLPLLLRMGSPMIMGGTAALAGSYTMLFSSVLFPFLSHRYTEKEKKEYEERRQIKYKEYLDAKRKEIEEERARERRILCENDPECQTILNYPIKYREHLWERRPIDSDFLTVRLGAGDLPMIGEIEYPAQRFSLDEDNLEQEMYDLAEKPVIMQKVPIVLDLKKAAVNGIVGDRAAVLSFIKRMVAQISVFHSYDEVKLVFLLDEEELDKLEFVKFLPHTWDDERSIRFIATNTGEACLVGEYLKGVLLEDLEQEKENNSSIKARPHYVVFELSKKISDSVEAIKDILQQEKPRGFTLFAVFDDLPKECATQIFILSDKVGTITYLREIEKEDQNFLLDAIPEQKLLSSMKTMSNTYLKMQSQEFALPKTYSFLEMFNVGRVEHLNPLKRWRESNPVTSLAVPVGVSTDGSLFMLDLHQKFQGPHGLVAGMTGSGKSEFLVTYILSLAITFHPDDVAFVLIDYKGGGLAGAFEDPEKGIHLPHLVATITNLDGSTVQRSLVSIQSELKRRQRVFNEVKSLSNEGTIDIYKYQKLYRSGVVKEPMPHLFIISDEFAELKQQQPEFMDQLISIARIGRSLGVHLILATQKPAGVVNEQIRSNTKFRVCLKVQDKADSLDMLLRPEAAGLKETGRFYLQVGYNEQFSLGQSAWSGAPYLPQDEVVVHEDNNLRFLDPVGQSLLEMKTEKKLDKGVGSQLVAVVQKLSDIAKEQGIQPRSLWKPTLPERLDYTKMTADTDLGDGHLRVCLGMLDDPERQEQFPLVYDFTACPNLLVVGDGGSGKTTLVHTILRSLLSRFTPQEFQFYALDYSGRLLKMYLGLPHCGNVLVEEDNLRLEKFFDMVHDIVAERKKLFSELELDDFDAVRKVRPIPLILVFIDNLSGLSASKEGERISYNLPGIIKDGVNFGVKFIVTASHYNSVSSRIKQELGDHIALHLKDKYEYAEALNCKCERVPPDKPGRGLHNCEGRPLEFQAVMYDPFADESERSTLLKNEIAALTAKNAGGQKALRLPVVDPEAEFADFMDQFRLSRIPIGFSATDGKPVALPLKQFSILSIYQGNPKGSVPVMENLLRAVLRERGEVLILRKTGESLFDPEAERLVDPALLEGVQIMTDSQENLSALWKTWSVAAGERDEIHKKCCEELQLDPDAEKNRKASFAGLMRQTKPKFVVFESYTEFCRNADFMSRVVFSNLIRRTMQENIYMICFFAPDDDEGLKGNSLYVGFNFEQPCLLLGGRFGQQRMSVLPNGIELKEEMKLNTGIMYYRESYYPILMPCGVLPTDMEDEDDLSIF